MSAKSAVVFVDRSVSSTTRASTAVSANPTVIEGPSSSNDRAWPMAIVAAPVLVSPSRSVMVSVRVSVIRLAADNVLGSSCAAAVLPSTSWATARFWSSVTTPVALTLTVKTRSPDVAVRPSTMAPLSARMTASPVATSTSPVDPVPTFKL